MRAPLHAYLRRAPRAPVTLAVHHRGRPGREVLTDDAEDISVSGLFVHSEEPYTVGTLVGLNLALPGGRVEVTGRVVRVGLGASGRVGMGIMFTQLDGHARRLVEELVDGARR